MGSFLAIDFDASAAFPSDAATAATGFRRSLVERRLQNAFNLARVPLNNPTTWSQVDTALNNQVAYIVCAGDGSEAAFPAPPNSQVFPPDNMATQDLQFRIIHMLACSTAVILGPQLVTTWKAAAFIGYSGLFNFPDPSDSSTLAGFAQTFVNCDAQIDFVLAQGGTVSAAIQAALNQFETQAQVLDPVNPSLANMLRQNATLLCGPTIDNEFGSASASIATSLQQLATTP